MAKIKVRWTCQAVKDLVSARDFLASERPLKITFVLETLLKAIEQIKIFPECGRMGRVLETRELVLTIIPFIIVYRWRHQTIEILSILHQSRKWP